MIHMTPQERRILLFISFLLIAGLVLSISRKSPGTKLCLFDFYSLKGQGPSAVNVNEATHQELTALPGIGEKTADAIISYRIKNGNFSSIDELKVIKGIGDLKLKKLRKYLSVS